jgi:potassium efflux system protein
MPRFFISLVIFISLLPQDIFAKPYNKAQTDSVKKVAAVRRHIMADSIRRNVTQVVFSPGYADTLILQIDHLHTTLNKITNESKFGFKTDQIERELKDMKAGIKVIDASLGRDSTVLDINSLQMFRGLLQDMEEKLSHWRTTLYNNNNDLTKMTGEMREFVQDSFAQKVAADTSFGNLHLDEMLILRDKWREAKKSTNVNLDHISKLLAEVSTTYFNVVEMQNIVNNQLVNSGTKTFGREYNYIWNTHTVSKLNETTSLTAQSYAERMQILAYYLRLNTEDWMVILFIGLVFFIWVFRNFRKIRLTGGKAPIKLALVYIRPITILSTVIFTLNIAPFYDFDQPAIYVEMILLVLLVPLTIMFFGAWSRQMFYFWCILVGLSLLTSTMNAIITPGWPLRYFMIALNIGAIGFGIRFFSLYAKASPLGKVVKWVILLFILMHAAAILSNIAGRVTLGRILTSAAVMGLIQIIGLFVTVLILTEAFYLQMVSSRISGGMAAAFKFEDIRTGLYRLLATGAILLWLVSFTTSLDIYTMIVDVLDNVLNTQRKIGSTNYSYGNILTFIFVVYVVSVMQKYIGYFFGETQDEFVGNPDKNQSRLVIFRLIIIVGGFFIAVVASGLPVDKVTVVLGALGVGIGLGLQNIVYNLVSGLVLIFEKPMEIGDYVEVSDKKGRVQNIGIRSSTLRTNEGSEVIVPNGDFLSTHMVNWTRGNDNRRTELTIGIEPASEIENAKNIILEELKASTFVIQERPVEILLNNMSEKSVTLQIYVWINSIYKEPEFKSEIISNVYRRLSEKNIKIV